jgi:hypothetical protein
MAKFTFGEAVIAALNQAVANKEQRNRDAREEAYRYSQLEQNDRQFNIGIDLKREENAQAQSNADRTYNQTLEEFKFEKNKWDDQFGLMSRQARDQVLTNAAQRDYYKSQKESAKEIWVTDSETGEIRNIPKANYNQLAKDNPNLKPLVNEFAMAANLQALGENKKEKAKQNEITKQLISSPVPEEMASDKIYNPWSFGGMLRGLGLPVGEDMGGKGYGGVSWISNMLSDEYKTDNADRVSNLTKAIKETDELVKDPNNLSNPFTAKRLELMQPLVEDYLNNANRINDKEGIAAAQRLRNIYKTLYGMQQQEPSK